MRRGLANKRTPTHDYSDSKWSRVSGADATKALDNG